MRTMTRSTLAFFCATFGATVAVPACTSGGSADRTGVARATLHRAASCGDLRSMLAADALEKMNARIDQEIAWLRQGGPTYVGYGAPRGSGGSLDMADAGASAGGAGGTGGAVPEQATSHSDTNTQVAGVDEADIVKTDGKYLYVLHGDRMLVVNAWPATSLAIADSLQVEGSPVEMFVADGRAAIYSTVDGSPIFAAAGVTPRSTYNEYGWGYGVGMAGGSTVDPTPAPAPDQGPTGSGPSPVAYAPLTKLTIVELTGSTPTVVGEHWYEGNYLSSRRMGAEVRTVLTGGAHGPALPGWPTMVGGVQPQTVDEMVAAWETLRVESAQLIAQSRVEDWLPYDFARTGSTVTASTLDCDRYYVPTAGTTAYGLVQLRGLDWTAPGASSGVSVVGDAQTVYANASSLYLAAAAWTDTYLAADLALGAVPTTPVPSSWTHLHKFDLGSTGGDPTYVGSGTVVGSVGDQFALDERDGVLRVATTEDRMWFGPSTGTGGTDVGVGGAAGATGGSGGVAGASDGGTVTVDAGVAPPPSGGQAGGAASKPWAFPGSRTQDDPAVATARSLVHVFTLAPDGDVLQIVGDVGNLAPNERIYSTRFVGPRGYVVTFQQVDPLFVIDLADAAHPTLLGELTIPGFSEYMHPLDDGHLLTIGKETEVGPGGGVHTLGVKLQVFDVTDGAHPAVVGTYSYGDPSGSTTASWDHKAFTYFADQKALAFPYSTWDSTASYGLRSSLEVFHVAVGDPITPILSIDHSPLFSGVPQGGFCGGYYGIDVRRGVFLDNFVYSVSYGGVVVSDLTKPAAPLASLAFPAPDANQGGVPCGYAVDGGGGVPAPVPGTN